MNRQIISFDSKCFIFKKIQWIFRDSEINENLFVFQSDPSPPDAPQAEIACAPLLFQFFLLAWRKAASSILVSWMRRISGASNLIKLFIDSSLALVPIPLQFQETIFIIYFCCDGLPWSPDVGSSLSSRFLPIASLELVGCPKACPCRFLVLFFPLHNCVLLWIFR